MKKISEIEVGSFV